MSLLSVQSALPKIQQYCGNSGNCNASVQLRYLNLARSLLWNKTDTRATCEYAAICCYDNCLTLPSLYKQIRLAWLDGFPVSLGNEWYQSIPQGYGLNEEHSCHRKLIEIGGNHVTFQNYGAPYLLQVEAESALDNGQSITFFGEDQYGTKIKESITIGLAPAFVSSLMMYQVVSGVTKQITKGRIRLYAFDPNFNLRTLLSVYQPYDVNPSFRRYLIQGHRSHGGCGSPPVNGQVVCAPKPRVVTVFAKKDFHDVVDMDDQVEFTKEALIHAVMAVVFRENKGSDQEYQSSLGMAVAEVNRETADQEEPVGSPLRQFNPNNDSALIGTYGSGLAFGGWGGIGGY